MDSKIWSRKLNADRCILNFFDALNFNYSEILLVQIFGIGSFRRHFTRMIARRQAVKQLQKFRESEVVCLSKGGDEILNLGLVIGPKRRAFGKSKFSIICVY